jgi:hypothetical protein
LELFQRSLWGLTLRPKWQMIMYRWEGDIAYKFNTNYFQFCEATIGKLSKCLIQG